MANMSYCRFRNTLADLEDCYENLDRVSKEDDPEEYRAFVRMVQLCKIFAEDAEANHDL